MEISPEVRAQVLREAAAEWRSGEHTFTVTDGDDIVDVEASEIAGVFDDLAAREEGRAAYLSEQRKERMIAEGERVANEVQALHGEVWSDS